MLVLIGSVIGVSGASSQKVLGLVGYLSSGDWVVRKLAS